jgi:hypothetical protein
MSLVTAKGQGLRAPASATVLAMVLLWAGTAAAQPKEAGGATEGPRRGPPPEAVAACKSLAAGTACSVTLSSNTLKGSCWAPEGMPLACRPAGAPVPDSGKRTAVAK